jgi:hypothetical protein
MCEVTSFFCDPAWHDGSTKVEAKFLIQPIPEERMFYLNGYATCEIHAGRALSIMLEKLKSVTVREVNKADG